MNPAKPGPWSAGVAVLWAALILAGCKGGPKGTVATVGSAGGAAVAPPVDAGEPPPVVAEEPAVRIQKEFEAAAKLDPALAAKMNTVRPVLKCVEKLSDTEWRAHFGFTNPTGAPAQIPIGFYNRFWPPPIAQGQPTAFPTGSRADVVQVAFNGASSAVWILGTSFQEAKATSPLCAGTAKAQGRAKTKPAK